MKLLLLTRTLGYGGAERQVIVLANELTRRGHHVSIGVFYDDAELAQELDISRVRVIALRKRARWDLLPLLWKLWVAVRRERFDVLQGFGSGPNLIATIVYLLSSRVNLSWSVRKSSTAMVEKQFPTDFGWLGRHLSCFANCIIFNSRAGLEYAIRSGFAPSKLICIPNGIDTDTFYPDILAGKRIRAEWGFTDGEKVIGLVARLDPAKNHMDFLRAAALVAHQRPDARFVCIGEGPTNFRKHLQALSTELKIADRVRWLEPRHDMRAVYNAMDLLCSSSITEGFPNVVGEALACARPCIVTDVGDCSFLVGKTGLVVPPSDPSALAEGVLAQLSCGVGWNTQGRERILSNFTLQHLGSRIEKALSVGTTL